MRKLIAALMLAATIGAAGAQTSGVGSYTNDPTEPQRYWDFQAQEAVRDRAGYDAIQNQRISELERQLRELQVLVLRMYNKQK